tara:strand:- start:115 stop:510 length:396 start_codon:yes stop_codon:yes gene_type:complete
MSGDNFERRYVMKRHSYSKMNGSAIEKARNLLNITQEKMADLLGISLRMYSFYISNQKKVPIAIELAIEHLIAISSGEKPEMDFSPFDLTRMKALRNEIDKIIGIGSVDSARLEKILKQSKQELDNVLSKF